jgi:hypothetical protein
VKQGALTRVFSVALWQALASLTTMVAPIAGQIVTILCRRASDALLPVRSIPSQFRAMQNKKMPAERSYFVPLIMRPVSSYFGIKTTEGGVGASLKDAYMKQFASEVFRVASQRSVIITHGRVRVFMELMTSIQVSELSIGHEKDGRVPSTSEERQEDWFLTVQFWFDPGGRWEGRRENKTSDGS